MASDSQASMEDWDWGRFQTRIEYHVREEDPSPLGSEGRVDSNEIRHLGGHFSDAPEAEGQDLDPSDLEAHPGDADDNRSPAQPGLTSYTGSPSRGDTPPSHSQPTPLIPDRYRHIPGGAYLSPAEFARWRRNNDIRNQSRSSGHSSGEYRTAQGSQSVTTVEDEEGEHIERVATPYFTPSHTPSHRSLATEDYGQEEDQSGAIGRAPDSPAPFSDLYQHQLGVARGAIDAYDSHFTEIHRRGSRGH